MESEGSLLHSQVPATCLFLSQPNSVYTLKTHFQKIHVNFTLPSTPGSFPQVFPPNYISIGRVKKEKTGSSTVDLWNVSEMFGVRILNTLDWGGGGGDCKTLLHNVIVKRPVGIHTLEI
jgi:hypothetical protein